MHRICFDFRGEKDSCECLFHSLSLPSPQPQQDLFCRSINEFLQLRAKKKGFLLPPLLNTMRNCSSKCLSSPISTQDRAGKIGSIFYSSFGKKSTVLRQPVWWVVHYLFLSWRGRGVRFGIPLSEKRVLGAGSRLAYLEEEKQKLVQMDKHIIYFIRKHLLQRHYFLKISNAMRKKHWETFSSSKSSLVCPKLHTCPPNVLGEEDTDIKSNFKKYNPYKGSGAWLEISV